MTLSFVVRRALVTLAALPLLPATAGATLSTPAQVPVGGTAIQESFVAVAPDGAISVAWRLNDAALSGRGAISVATRAPGRSSFGTPTLVGGATDPATQNTAIALSSFAAGPDGALGILYTDFDPTGDPQTPTYLVTRAPGASSFTAPQLVVGDSLNYSSAVYDASGRLHLTWTTSAPFLDGAVTDASGQLSDMPHLPAPVAPRALLPDANTVDYGGTLRLRADGSGVLGYDQRSENTSPVRPSASAAPGAHLARLAPDGSLQGVELIPGSPTTQGAVRRVDAVPDADGRTVVLWHQVEYSPVAIDLLQYAVRNADGSWQPVQTLPQTARDQAAIASDGNGFVVIAWVDADRKIWATWRRSPSDSFSTPIDVSGGITPADPISYAFPTVDLDVSPTGVAHLGWRNSAATDYYATSLSRLSSSWTTPVSVLQEPTLLFESQVGTRLLAATPSGGVAYAVQQGSKGPVNVTFTQELPFASRNVVSGSPEAGGTLTCSAAWVNAVSSTVQLQRNGASVTAPYVVTSADAGATFRCALSATNDFGTVPETLSAPVTIPVPSSPGGSSTPTVKAPALLKATALKGTPKVGKRLTCSAASFSGATSTVIAWLRNGKAIKGASGKTYKLKAADRGKRVACRVTAANSAGSIVSASKAVKVRR